LTGFFATPKINANLDLNLKDIVGRSLWLEQLKAIGFTMIYSVLATVVLFYVVKAICRGFRPNEEDERTGLDLSDHGEVGYHP
ncbi:MAG TPA: hypothetical protein VN764_16545, partial [Polyangiaceae bacterium]|nr:hypothetical protein [Polyangiaceae bacterium]